MRARYPLTAHVMTNTPPPTSTRLRPGLVSVTFRKLTPREIIDVCVANGLDGIEWGGDIHVPHGDLQRAHDVGEMTRTAGLDVFAYGSYYKARTGGEVQSPEFDDVLASAVALGVPLIRVWAGNVDGADAPSAVRDAVASDLRRVCDLAGAKGVRVALEYHGGTLTDTLDSTVALLEAVDNPNLATLWQPRNWNTPADNVAEIRLLAPWIANVHVFHWPNGEWRPLVEGASSWEQSFRELAKLGRPVNALLEFVRGETTEQLSDDAATLHDLLNSLDESS